MLRSTILLLFLCINTISGQAIRLDESVEEWTSAIPSYEDANDNNSLDIISLAIADDADALYLKIELDRAILIQGEEAINVSIFHNGNILSYNLGETGGRFRETELVEVTHDDIGLVVSPTVRSRIFEIKLDKRWQFNNSAYTIDGLIEIGIFNSRVGGDNLPDNGTISYTLTTDQEADIPTYSLEKAGEADFRLCSYNVKFDRLFESETRTEYSQILRTINPDIICFQEIFDNTASQTQNRLLNVFGALDRTQTWYNSKRGADNIIISRFPIIFEREIAGNGVFVVTVDDQEVMIVNIHLPCCERDDDREDEIDALLSFIRDSKNGNTNYVLRENTPIVITGDANFVGNSDQVAALTYGRIFNNAVSGSDFELDWDDDGLTDLKPFATGFNTLHTFFNPFGRFAKGRLDYTFYSDFALTALNTFSLDTDGLSEDELQRYDLERYYSNFASDHYPMVVDFMINGVVSTAEELSSTPTIWPNPTSDIVNIEVGKASFRKATLYNSYGQYMLQTKQAKIDLRTLDAGIYYLKVETEGESYLQKMVKL